MSTQATTFEDYLGEIKTEALVPVLNGKLVWKIRSPDPETTALLFSFLEIKEEGGEEKNLKISPEGMLRNLPKIQERILPRVVVEPKLTQEQAGKILFGDVAKIITALFDLMGFNEGDVEETKNFRPK